MNILYVCTQPPGVGGASTETYEAIKRLRTEGCRVTGLFIVGRQCECGQCDPDSIEDITAVAWSGRDDPAILMGDFDVVIGKNYEAAWVIRKRTDLPTVYLTSGIDYVSRFDRPAISFQDMLPNDGLDVRAFRSTRYAIVHSTIDLTIYRRFLPPDLFARITGDVVYTPNIAVPPLDQHGFAPYAEREFDLCFSASSWKRTMKNPQLLYEVCRRLKDRYRIVVCGNDFTEPGVTAVGLIPHAEMINILGRSRVVAIPSFYDPSPNLYPEATYSGCNVVCTANIGNIRNHPAELLAPNLSVDRFTETVVRALNLTGQLAYKTPTPTEATNQLLERLNEIVRDFHRAVGRTNARPCRPDNQSPPRQHSPVKEPSPVQAQAQRPVTLTRVATEEIVMQQMHSFLTCPACGRSPLFFQADMNLRKHRFTCSVCNTVVELNRGVAEFEVDDHHVDSFTDEWDRHSRVQVDSHGYRCGYRGFADSHDTFWKKTALNQEDLRDKIVLDGGCGVGRFTEVVAETARGVIAVDLSHAVYHAAALMAERGFGHALCMKANLENLPLIDGCIDVAFTVGVAHHSPNPLKVMQELVRVTKRGGIVCGWLYAKHRSYGNPARGKVRAFTTDPANFDWVRRFAEMAPALRDLSLRGGWDELREVLGISSSLNDEECVLDTFDWLTPKYQYQYTADEVRQMLVRLGLTDIVLPPFPVSFQAKKL